MIIRNEINKTPFIGIAFMPMYTLEDVKELRDALMEALENCISSEVGKDLSNPHHLYLLSCMIKELTKDVESSKEGGTV